MYQATVLAKNWISICCFKNQIEARIWLYEKILWEKCHSGEITFNGSLVYSTGLLQND